MYWRSSTASTRITSSRADAPRSGLGHAWPWGSTNGSYTDPCGPDASTLIADFFGF